MTLAPWQTWATFNAVRGLYLLQDTTKAYGGAVHDSVQFSREKALSESQKADEELRARELQDWDERLQKMLEEKDEDPRK
jgi:hypothetical protein